MSEWSKAQGRVIQTHRTIEQGEAFQKKKKAELVSSIMQFLESRDFRPAWAHFYFCQDETAINIAPREKGFWGRVPHGGRVSMNVLRNLARKEKYKYLPMLYVVRLNTSVGYTDDVGPFGHPIKADPSRDSVFVQWYSEDPPETPWLELSSVTTFARSADGWVLDEVPATAQCTLTEFILYLLAGYAKAHLL